MVFMKLDIVKIAKEAFKDKDLFIKNLPKDKVNFQICPTCGTKLRVEGTKELIEALTEKAETFGSKVELISTDTREGKQFKELGGVGALLRYKV